MSSSNNPLSVSFLTSAPDPAIQASEVASHPLLAVAFGSGPNTTPSYPMAVPGLRPIDGMPFVEMWRTGETLSYASRDGFQIAIGDTLMAGTITLDDSLDAPFEASTYELYSRFFDLIEGAGFPYLLRVFNYFSGITDTPDGFERYQRFSLGRHDAFAARARPVATSPATCAIGCRTGGMTLAFIASKTAGLALENPRQISAYSYPERYGPRSPIFSRALLFTHRGTTNFFLSGTASIVGHETCHAGDAPAQARETMTNIAAMRAQAVSAGLPHGHAMALRVYLRDAMLLEAVRPAVAAGLQPGDTVRFVEADICRRDLLLEIDGASL